MNVFSDYSDGTHGSGFVETNIFREQGQATATYITEDMLGTYRMSFKAKNNDCGGTNSDNGATGATCHAFVKVLTPGYAEQLMVKTETTGASTTEYETMNVDYELVADHVGSILQTGFMSYAGNYAPTSVLYDDVEVAAYTPAPAPEPTPVITGSPVKAAVATFAMAVSVPSCSLSVANFKNLVPLAVDAVNLAVLPA